VGFNLGKHAKKPTPMSLSVGKHGPRLIQENLVLIGFSIRLDFTSLKVFLLKVGC
jgi:hypothetical protein